MQGSGEGEGFGAVTVYPFAGVASHFVLAEFPNLQQGMISTSERNSLPGCGVNELPVLWKEIENNLKNCKNILQKILVHGQEKRFLSVKDLRLRIKPSLDLPRTTPPEKD